MRRPAAQNGPMQVLTAGAVLAVSSVRLDMGLDVINPVGVVALNELRDQAHMLALYDSPKRCKHLRQQRAPIWVAGWIPEYQLCHQCFAMSMQGAVDTKVELTCTGCQQVFSEPGSVAPLMLQDGPMILVGVLCEACSAPTWRTS